MAWCLVKYRDNFTLPNLLLFSYFFTFSSSSFSFLLLLLQCPDPHRYETAVWLNMASYLTFNLRHGCKFMRSRVILYQFNSELMHGHDGYVNGAEVRLCPVAWMRSRSQWSLVACWPHRSLELDPCYFIVVKCGHCAVG
jgi:hypothetical protein